MITDSEYALLCKAIRATDYYVRYQGLMFNWSSPQHCPGAMYNVAEDANFTEGIYGIPSPYATEEGNLVSQLTNPYAVYRGPLYLDNRNIPNEHGKNWKLLRRDIVEYYNISPKDIASAYPRRYKWPTLPDVCKVPTVY